MDKEQLRVLRPVKVEQVFDLNSRMRRVIVTGDNVKHFKDSLPGAWVKVFFSSPDKNEGPGRAYTISEFEGDNFSLTLDFVKHGEGPATRWVSKATPEEVIRIAGPREGINTNQLKSILLFGDETAIPGIFSIIKSLAHDTIASAIILVKGHEHYSLPDHNCNLEVKWIIDDNNALFQSVIEQSRNTSPEFIWGAGEHDVTSRIRQSLIYAHDFHRKSLNITAYWKKGEEDHRDT